jgi:hypothetical protein
VKAYLLSSTKTFEAINMETRKKLGLLPDEPAVAPAPKTEHPASTTKKTSKV